MSEHTELIRSIRDLTQRLEGSKTSFLDVFLSIVGKPLHVMTGQEHHHADPEVVAVLQELAIAMSKALSRQDVNIMKRVMYALGCGVSDGTHGPNFFDKL